MKDKIVLRKRATPKVVNLPNGNTFVARYERISWKQLPRNIRVTRTRKKIGPRKNNRRILLNLAGPALKKIRKKWRQSGKGLGGNLAKLGIEMGSRALNSSIGKRLINKGIDNIPDIFKYGVSKTNKNLKRALDSEVADMVVEEAQKK